MHRFRLIFYILFCALTSPLVADCRILDFDTAIKRTLEQSLILKQKQSDILSKKGGVKQASLYPNPALAYDLETSQHGWKERQDIYAINQLVETGGKREQRIQAAKYQYFAAMEEYETTKVTQLNLLSKAFIRVARAQELADLARKHQKNSEESYKLIHAKLEAGKGSIFQKNKAMVAQSLAELNLKKAIAEFKAAKNALALIWSSSCPDFERVAYPFFEMEEPLPLGYSSNLNEQPELIQSFYKSLAAYHNFHLEKAAKIPDVTITLGYGYDEGNKGIVAGVMVPLPIWNRNQGNIQRALSEMQKTEDEGKQLKLFLESKLSNAMIELRRAIEEADELKRLSLQASNQSLSLAQEGYREGKLEYWEVLSAQQTVLEIQEKYIEALAHFHNKKVEIYYLTSETP